MIESAEKQAAVAPRSRIRAIHWLAFLPLALLVALLVSPALRGELAGLILTLRADWADRQYVRGLPAVDSAEICLLESENRDPQATNRIFHVPIVGMHTLSGSAAEEFAAAWRHLPMITSPGEQTLCHYPVYGVRFRRGNSVVGEGTFCWKCENIRLPSRGSPAEIRFNRTSPEATNLFARFQKLFPLPDRTRPKVGAVLPAAP